MDKQIESWMKEWVDRVNEAKKPKEDFWIETSFGEFKNPKFIPSEKDNTNEINITIQCDEWKIKDNEKDRN
jgi:hypothetical protein